MQTFFQFIMCVLFGKHWVLFDLRQGYKQTLFMNEVETEMLKDRRNFVAKAKEELEAELKALEEKDMSDEAVLALMPEDQREDKKAFYDFQKGVRGKHAEEILTYKNRIKALESDLLAEDGELQKAFSITYKNRVKYDFIKNYKTKKSYADKK